MRPIHGVHVLKGFKRMLTTTVLVGAVGRVLDIQPRILSGVYFVNGFRFASPHLKMPCRIPNLKSGKRCLIALPPSKSEHPRLSHLRRELAGQLGEYSQSLSARH